MKALSSLKIPDTLKIPAALVVGMVVGGLLVWGVVREAPKLSEETRTPSVTKLSEEVAAPLSQVTNETRGPLLIGTQPAGFVVVVSHVSAKDPLWVVIYEDNGGQPGNALGAGRFTSEKTSGLVQLLRGTLPQSTYYGVLHRDDGDRVFSLESDFPLRDEEGTPRMVRFVTQ